MPSLGFDYANTTDSGAAMLKMVSMWCSQHTTLGYHRRIGDIGPRRWAASCLFLGVLLADVSGHDVLPSVSVSQFSVSSDPIWPVEPITRIFFIYMCRLSLML
jgi:hypothetical protein